MIVELQESRILRAMHLLYSLRILYTVLGPCLISDTASISWRLVGVLLSSNNASVIAFHDMMRRTHSFLVTYTILESEYWLLVDQPVHFLLLLFIPILFPKMTEL